MFNNSAKYHIWMYFYGSFNLYIVIANEASIFSVTSQLFQFCPIKQDLDKKTIHFHFHSFSLALKIFPAKMEFSFCRKFRYNIEA